MSLQDQAATTPSRTGRGLRRRAARWVVHAVVAAATVIAVPIGLAGPASAVEPIGGCWIWFDGTPQTDISSSLAPWANPDAEPKGPADHTITLAPEAPPAGSTGTIQYAYNKGPENKGPAAQVQGTFRFSINGDTEVSTTVDFGLISTNESIPGQELDIPFTVEEGENLVVFEGVTFTAQAFNVKIDCNGQEKGDEETNPRTDPQPTNVRASVTSVGTATGGPGAPEVPANPLCGLLPLAIPGCETPEPAPEPEPEPGPGEEPGGDPGDGDESGSGTVDGDGSGGGASAGGGTPAAGKVGFACVLSPFNSPFDWDPDVTVAGAPAGSGTALLATMSDLPGIAPVPIDGPMDVTLDLEVAGKATSVTGSSTVTVPPKTDVPVPDLKGQVAAAEASMPVVVKGFSFDFPSYSIDAVCEPKSGAELGDMVPGGSLSGGGGTTAGGAAASGDPSAVGSTVPGAATTADGAIATLGALNVMDARIEGSTGLAELFGAAPRRTLVLIVQNPTSAPVADPSVAMAVGRPGVTAEPMSMAMGTLAPGETRRIQLPIELTATGLGTYEVAGQIGGSPTGAFTLTWQSHPWGLYALLLLALVLLAVGLRRELGLRRARAAALTGPTDGDAPSSGGDAIVDLDRLDLAWARRPRRLGASPA